MVKESLKDRIDRVEAVQEIQNLMGRYEFFLTAGKFDEIVGLFAQKTPGVTAEISDRGVYEGIEGVRRLYAVEHKAMEKFMGTSFFSQHELATSVIEVAKDGKTAKGVWRLPGVCAVPDVKTGNTRAHWRWDTDAVHFVKEDGKWKIWKWHVYAVFDTPYEDGWVKTPWARGTLPPHLVTPDRPTTYHRPYNPAKGLEYVPAIPEPYNTYDENTPLP